MVNAKGLLKAGGFDLRCYHQESFDIESSTEQQNMTEPHEEPVGTMQFIGEVVEYRVTLKDTGKTTPCPSNTNILVAMQKQGINAPFACSMCMCGTCRVKMLDSTVDMDAQGGLLKSHEEEGYILTCCAHPTSDVELDL